MPNELDPSDLEKKNQEEQAQQSQQESQQQQDTSTQSTQTESSGVGSLAGEPTRPTDSQQSSSTSQSQQSDTGSSTPNTDVSPDEVGGSSRESGGSTDTSSMQDSGGSQQQGGTPTVDPSSLKESSGAQSMPDDSVQGASVESSSTAEPDRPETTLPPLTETPDVQAPSGNQGQVEDIASSDQPEPIPEETKQQVKGQVILNNDQLIDSGPEDEEGGRFKPDDIVVERNKQGEITAKISEEARREAAREDYLANVKAPDAADQLDTPGATVERTDEAKQREESREFIREKFESGELGKDDIVVSQTENGSAVSLSENAQRDLILDRVVNESPAVGPGDPLSRDDVVVERTDDGGLTAQIDPTVLKQRETIRNAITSERADGRFTRGEFRTGRVITRETDGIASARSPGLEAKTSDQQRFSTENLSNALESVEDKTGLDIPGAEKEVRTTKSGEQFGDFDYSAGFGDPNKDEVENALDDFSETLSTKSRNAGNKLFSRGVSGESGGAALLKSIGRNNLAASYDAGVRQFGSGIVTGAGSLVAQAPQVATEAPETAYFAVTEPTKTADRLPGAVSSKAAMAGEAAVSNPAQFAGTLTGSVAASGGVFMATRGTKLGLASRTALQPGEEVVKAGVRTGLVGKRAAKLTPGVRKGQAGLQSNLESNVESDSPNLRQRLGDRSPTLPNVGLEANPRAGAVEIDPELKKEIRRRTVGRVESRAQQVRDAPADAKQTLKEGASKGREFAGDVRTRSGEAVTKARQEYTRASVKVEDLGFRTAKAVDQQTQRLLNVDSSNIGRPSLDLRSRTAGAGALVSSKIGDAGRAVAVRSPSNRGDIVLQQAFLSDEDLPVPNAPSVDVPGSDRLPSDVRGRVKRGFSDRLEIIDDAGRRVAANSPKNKGDLALQQAIVGDEDFPTPTFSKPGRPSFSKPSVSRPMILKRARERVDSGVNRVKDAGGQVVESSPTNRGDLALQRAFLADEDLPTPEASLPENPAEGSVSEVRQQARREFVAAKFRVAEGADKTREAFSDIPDATLRIGEPSTNSILGGEVDEPAVRSQLSDPFGIGDDADTNTDTDTEDTFNMDVDSETTVEGERRARPGDTGVAFQRVIQRSERESKSESGLAGESSELRESAQSPEVAFDAEPSVSNVDSSIGEAVTEPSLGVESRGAVDVETEAAIQQELNVGTEPILETGVETGVETETEIRSELALETETEAEQSQEFEVEPAFEPAREPLGGFNELTDNDDRERSSGGFQERQFEFSVATGSQVLFGDRLTEPDSGNDDPVANTQREGSDPLVGDLGFDNSESSSENLEDDFLI